MNYFCLTLTIYFDGQFWIGVFESVSNEKLQVCKIVFGAEPSDAEVYEFIKNKANHLKFGTIVDAEKQKKKPSPKKMKKLIDKSLKEKGIGTKSQQAMKLQMEQRKLERKETKKEQKENEKELRFLQKQQKKKEKHKGH